MLTDIKFALRQLAKTPAFTVIALLTLAVGIGSATVVFSAINAFLFKPLPHIKVAEDRLVYATETNKLRGTHDSGWNYLDYTTVRERSQTLAGLWIHSDLTVVIAGTEFPERLFGTILTTDAFDLMGVRPLHGRNFTKQDALPDAPTVALISAAVWKSRYGSDLEAIGRAITLNGRPATIIGVMPDGWRYPEFSDVWLPFKPDVEKATSRGYYGLSGRGLLKPGVTIEAAQAELDTIMGSLAKEYPATNTGIGAHLRPIRGEAVEDTRDFTVLLFGAVMFVFLIACVNVANLLLARSVTRSKEVAIRLALGAERSRVVFQLLTESLVLGLLGGVGGLILGLWGNDAVVAAIPIEIPFWLRFDFDLSVFLFVTALSLVAALAFGLIPALKISRPDIVAELKEGGRSAETSGPRATRLRNALVILEIALALVLLVGAGLMMRSFIELRRIDPGFTSANILTFRTGWPQDMARNDPEAPARFFKEFKSRLAALPGVDAVASTQWRPGRDDESHTAYYLTSQPKPARAGDAYTALRRSVSPNFFSTVGIPLKAGRTFKETIDRNDSPRVAVVDELLATRHFGSAAAAIGQRLTGYHQVETPDTKPTVVEIVGVVGNIRHRLDAPDDFPTFYLADQQITEEALLLKTPADFRTIILRTQGDPASFEALVRETLLTVNREIPIYDVFTLEAQLLRSKTVWPRRFFGFLFTVFGCVALFLACIGIYGVMSYNVTQRVQELGVRLALGAEPREIIRLVVRHGLNLVGMGLAVGLIAAFALANLLSGLLYGVSPHDPPTFAIVPLLLAAVALVACWLPSRRATLIEPNAALRAE